MMMKMMKSKIFPKIKIPNAKLAKFQSSKSLLLRKQLGIDFFKRGEFELFTKKFS